MTLPFSSSSLYYCRYLNDDIGNLIYLETLLVHKNNLTWTIPTSLRHCDSLVHLDMSRNKIKGSINGAAFASMSKLATLAGHPQQPQSSSKAGCLRRCWISRH